MIDFPRFTVTVVLATLLTVAIGSPIPLAAADCDAADNNSQVAGEGLCLGI